MHPVAPTHGHHLARSLALACGLVGASCLAPVSSALAQDDGGENPVAVDEFGTVDIAVQDADLAQVLQMLSIESRKNIITSKAVSGTVTANLYGVNFYEALRTILRMNGLSFEEEDGFIYIYTNEEFQLLEDERRQRESRIFQLDHLAAVDAIEFIAPLLSETGRASARGEVQPGFVPSDTNGGEDSYAFAATVVVNDYTENLDAIASLLEELDISPKQVMVESTILSAKVNEADAFGVDFSIIGSIDFADLTNPLSLVNNLLQGNDQGAGVKATSEQGFQPADNNAFGIVSSPGNTQGPATLKVGVVSDDLSIFLRVLDEVTDTVVLARPRVMALNRQRAQVLIGAKIGYLSTTSTETTTTQTVEFLDTGIQLTFRPFISRNNKIRMELKPSVSEAFLRSNVSADGLIVTIPDEATNEVTTNVSVRDGETIVLGGLFREETTTTRRQVPYLGDIPVLGAAFKGYDNAIERDEIIFLITPNVVKDDLAARVGEEALGYIDAVRVGAREGLLPFSRTKLTADYNRDAIDAWSSGDAEKALYYLNNSLRSNPQQPEMILLRDEINRADSTKSNHRSVMDLMQDALMDSQTPQSNAAPMRDPLASTQRFINVPEPGAVEDPAVAADDAVAADALAVVDESVPGSENVPSQFDEAFEQAFGRPASETTTDPAGTASGVGVEAEEWNVGAPALADMAAVVGESAADQDGENGDAAASFPANEPVTSAGSPELEQADYDAFFANSVAGAEVPYAWNPWLRLWWDGAAEATSGPDQIPGSDPQHAAVNDDFDG